MAETLLALRDITVRHGAGTVLEVRSLDIYTGEVVVVIGANGAGKSTLLRVMGLLQWPTLGKVYFRNEPVTPKNSLDVRRHMASLFHEPLLLDCTVYANAALGLKLRGFDRHQIDKRLSPWLERLGIAHLSSRHIRTLSGGEAQRTSLARGLVLNPKLLLLDEPFSALDAQTRETLLLDLQDILADTQIATVMVTHDLREAAGLGQRIGVLSRGKMLQLAPAREVFAHPVSEEVATIVGIETRIAAVVQQSADGMSTVHFDGGTAQVSGEFPAGARVTLCVRSEDIDVLHPNEQQNDPKETVYISARVRRISPSLPDYRVALESDCGQLVARVGKIELSELLLREGDDVVASFKRTAIQVIS